MSLAILSCFTVASAMFYYRFQQDPDEFKRMLVYPCVKVLWFLSKVFPMNQVQKAYMDCVNRAIDLFYEKRRAVEEQDYILAELAAIRDNYRKAMLLEEQLGLVNEKIKSIDSELKQAVGKGYEYTDHGKDVSQVEHET